MKYSKSLQILACLLVNLFIMFSVQANESEKALSPSLFDSLWVNVRGGMGSGYAHAIALQRGPWGVEHSYLVFNKDGYLFGDDYFDETTQQEFEPELHGSTFSLLYRHVGSVGTLKASLGLGYFNGEWGFDCRHESDFLGDNQYCNVRKINDVALVYGVEAVFGRYWGLGVSADYAIVQGETLIMGGVSLPIRVLSN